jgi:hypothetical protein
MFVLSGVLNTTILDAPNYVNQYYIRVNYTLIVAIKTRHMFLPGYGPIAIADWSIIVQCHILVKHGY